MLADFTHDLLRKFGAAVVHGHEHADQLETGINPALLELGHEAGEHGNAFERVVFALKRNKDSFRGGKSVQGQNAEGGRAIDEHDIVTAGLEDRFERGGDPLQMIFGAGKFEISTTEIDFAGDEV